MSDFCISERRLYYEFIVNFLQETAWSGWDINGVSRMPVSVMKTQIWGKKRVCITWVYFVLNSCLITHISIKHQPTPTHTHPHTHTHTHTHTHLELNLMSMTDNFGDLMTYVSITFTWNLRFVQFYTDFFFSLGWGGGWRGEAVQVHINFEKYTSEK